MTARLPTVAYTVTFEDGPSADWQLLSFLCEEEVNGGCRMTLELATDHLDAELEEFLGASLEVVVSRDDYEQFFFAVVVRVDLLGRADEHVVLRVRAVSALELAKQRRHSRIFQEMPVNDVVAAVLDEALADYDRSHRLDAAERGTDNRTYCVQYRETDYDYVHRLLEEDGISYYLLHDPDAGHEVVVMCDANEQYPEAENIDTSTSFPLIASNQEEADVESLQSLEWVQRLTTTATLRRDFDWQTPTDLLTSDSTDADARGRERRIYVHGQRRFESDDLSTRAADLAESLALDGNVANGTSNAIALRPGMKFSTDAHHFDGAPGEYIVTRVRHRGGSHNAGALGGRGQDVAYANEFDCVEASSVIRPRQVTPKPRMHGPQTATVVGDEEIHTDEWGRIQVQFHWQEEPSYAADASCWMRVAQSWAQGGWGAQFIPRVGMEVVVEFLEGNPDRPLVTGCVYNGNHEPPFPLPANSTQSGWRTNSSPGGGGSNELRFEDAAGSEEIYIHGQKDWNVEIINNTSKSTGNDETHSVGHDRTKDVGNNETETIGVDKTITVGSNHTEGIGTNMDLTVGANRTVTVGADQTIDIGSNLTESVGVTCSQTVLAAKKTKVGGMYSIMVGGSFSRTVGAMASETVAGARTVRVGAASKHQVALGHKLSAKTISEKAKTTMEIDAGTDLTAKGGKKVMMDSGGPFGAKAKTDFVVDAGDKITIKCGKASMTLKKNGDIVLKGKKVTVKGSSKITLKGGKINKN